jgi:hypothetical protein
MGLPFFFRGVILGKGEELGRGLGSLGRLGRSGVS